jgi:hypothetical protein
MKTKLVGNKFLYSDTSNDSDTEENMTFEEIPKNHFNFRNKEKVLSDMDTRTKVDWKFIFDILIKNLLEKKKISIHELELRVNSILSPYDDNLSYNNKNILKEKYQYDSKNKNKNKFIQSVMTLYNNYKEDRFNTSKQKNENKYNYKHNRNLTSQYAKSPTMFSTINSLKFKEDFQIENKNPRDKKKTNSFLINTKDYSRRESFQNKAAGNLFKTSADKIIVRDLKEDYNSIKFEKSLEPVRAKGILY